MKNILTAQLLLLVFMFALTLMHKNSLIPSKPAFLLFALSVLSVALLGFAAIVWFVYSALVLGKQGSSVLLISFIVGAFPVLAFFVLLGPSSLKVPRIHDISTRFDPPIQFKKVQSMRSAGDHDAELPDTNIMQMQQAFYTDIKGLTLNASVADVFQHSAIIIEEYDWVPVASDEGKYSGWIELYVETALFGFKDDVRIEVRALTNNSVLVDIRSASRFGQSDLGANAQRIRRFLKDLESRLSP